MSFFSGSVSKIYSGNLVNQVRTQLHRYLSSPTSTAVKKEVLDTNFSINFKDENESKLMNDGSLNRIESIQMINTFAGTKFNAKVSHNNEYLFDFDILINVVDEPLNLLPKLTNIDVSLIADKNSNKKNSNVHDNYKENRALSFVYFWLNLVEAGNNKIYNKYIMDEEIFKNVCLYNDNFNWFSGKGSGWNNCGDVEKWFTSLPSQMINTCHWMKNFKIIEDIDDIKNNLSQVGLNNFDELLNNNGKENIITFSMEFDWNGLQTDNKTLWEAATKHYWVLIDNKNDSLPKLARANVEMIKPFQPLKSIKYEIQSHVEEKKEKLLCAIPNNIASRSLISASTPLEFINTILSLQRNKDTFNIYASTATYFYTKNAEIIYDNKAYVGHEEILGLYKSMGESTSASVWHSFLMDPIIEIDAFNDKCTNVVMTTNALQRTLFSAASGCDYTYPMYILMQLQKLENNSFYSISKLHYNSPVYVTKETSMVLKHGKYSTNNIGDEMLASNENYAFNKIVYKMWNGFNIISDKYTNMRYGDVWKPYYAKDAKVIFDGKIYQGIENIVNLHTNISCNLFGGFQFYIIMLITHDNFITIHIRGNLLSPDLKINYNKNFKMIIEYNLNSNNQICYTYYHIDTNQLNEIKQMFSGHEIQSHVEEKKDYIKKKTSVNDGKMISGKTFYGSSFCIIKQGKAEEFKNLVLSENGYNLISRGQKQDGNIFYIVMQDNANPNKFIWFEQWKDFEAVKNWTFNAKPSPKSIFEDPKVKELFIDGKLHVESPKGYTQFISKYASKQTNSAVVSENEGDGKTADISATILEDTGNDKYGCICVFMCKLIKFIASLLVLILCFVIYFPILLIMALITFFSGALFGCCVPYLRREIILCGGFSAWFSFFIRNKFEIVWTSMTYIPIFKNILNDYYTASLLSTYTKHIHRIPQYNLKHDYVTMGVLYDESNTYYQRVLPSISKEKNDSLPPIDDVTSCFMRDKFTPETNAKLSLLIGYYAQWFSHQFFNTKPNDPKMVNQPVGINLGQLYGSTLERQNHYRSFKKGLLRSSWMNDEEYPPIIDGISVGGHDELFYGTKKFDIPLELATMVPGFAAIHIIFFRHHQYIARTLYKYYSDKMDDEKIYQTTRIIMALTVIKITMEDYVANGLQTSNVKVRFDPNVMDSFVYKCFGPKNGTYDSTNAIQTEFNFAYRWHQFYPDKIPLDINNEAEAKYLEFPLNKNWNAVHYLTDSNKCKGRLENLLLAASKQSSGKLTLLNTNKWLAQHVVKRGLVRTRETRLASYNDYRERFGFQRIKRFEDITHNKDIVEKLKSVYKSVDDIDYYVGIWAEQKIFGGVHGPFLAHIGVGFTYTGIFASRLWKTNRVNKKSLTPVGLKLINDIGGINDICHLHANLNDVQKVSFTVNNL